MKLWLLKVPGDPDRYGPDLAPPAWVPWYDKVFGFVIRAETEADARRIAAHNGANETRDVGTSPWLDPELVPCVELVPRGAPGVVLRDLWSA